MSTHPHKVLWKLYRLRALLTEGLLLEIGKKLIENWYSFSKRPFWSPRDSFWWFCRVHFSEREGWFFSPAFSSSAGTASVWALSSAPGERRLQGSLREAHQLQRGTVGAHQQPTFPSSGLLPVTAPWRQWRDQSQWESRGGNSQKWAAKNQSTGIDTQVAWMEQMKIWRPSWQNGSEQRPEKTGKIQQPQQVTLDHNTWYQSKQTMFLQWSRCIWRHFAMESAAKKRVECEADLVKRFSFIYLYLLVILAGTGNCSDRPSCSSSCVTPWPK